jgi:hypothetical protein
MLTRLWCPCTKEELDVLSSTSTPQNWHTDNKELTHIFAVQKTPYWMVETSFWIHQNCFHPIVTNENIGSTRVDSARVAIVPQVTTPFRIVFDFAPKFDLPTRITYQPIVRNGSEIFGLQRAIENGTASLGDRDEQGLPLLYVS